ncbi:MAG: HRDC domain-containing protein [Lachnospiraceae bacterium]|nr:HRDC domain-containing protein [Lachnospiraceae bacterium]
MLLNEYLTVTNDEYSIVKLTENSEKLLCGGTAVIMKMAKEAERVPKSVKEKKQKKSKAAAEVTLTEQDEVLFEKLRALRLMIAGEEKVPPYLVFSDKTLAHMCALRPKNREEMLTVSGVGEHKYEKYGERFLTVIRNG